jgi:hypothetical protein
MTNKMRLKSLKQYQVMKPINSAKNITHNVSVKTTLKMLLWNL